MTDWFEEWFGEEYLQLYPHRDKADAARMVTLLRGTLPWRQGWRVLDVGCGPGRHSEALEAAGARPIGLDLSATLLDRAREVTRAPLVRADMRALPVRDGSMDLTVNLFTSFGYFQEDEAHRTALQDMVRTVRRGGWFAIDFLNPEQVRRDLVAAEELSLGSQVATVTRRITDHGRFVLKTIRTPDGREFMERVRLFEPEELREMLTSAGIRLTAEFGSYDGTLLSTSSHRTIFMGTRQ